MYMRGLVRRGVLCCAFGAGCIYTFATPLAVIHASRGPGKSRSSPRGEMDRVGAVVGNFGLVCGGSFFFVVVICGNLGK